MKKAYLLFLAILLMNTSCAIQGEVFRLQTRMKYWYDILNSEEEKLFAENKIEQLGVLLNTQENDNPEFKQKLRDIRINEAIMSFDSEQTAHFFYYVLLRDLAKFSYKAFMNSLSVEEKKEFINTKYYTSNPFLKQESILEKARKLYGFQSFTDENIINYYRNIVFPANYYIIVYDVLAFLARYRNLDLFLQGDIENTVALFEDIDKMKKSRRVATRTQAKKDQENWINLKKRTYLKDISDKEFLTLLYNTVLPEMDATVREKTIDNVRQRFKEE